MAEREPEPEVDLAELHEQLAAFDVEQLLVSSASTIASLAFAKVERGELDQAKKAIDALASILPHVEGPAAAGLRQALTELQVAYAGAVSR